jgi:hypothetical protein
MSNPNFFQSLLDSSLAIDIEGAKNASGTPLDVFTMKLAAPLSTPPTAAQLSAAGNQLWALAPGPIANSYFIKSQLNNSLVIDIKGAKNASGTPVQVYTQKPTSTPAEIESAKNQLWTLAWVEQPGPAGTLRMSYIFIESVLDTNLVLDIEGGKTTPGTGLQVYTKKPVGTTEQFNEAKNQLWSEVPVYLPPPK